MQPQKPMHDVSANQGQNPMEVEIEHNIPIKQHDAAEESSAAQPAVPAKQFVESGGKNDKDLEKALADASQGVKNIVKVPAKRAKISLKMFGKKKTAKAAPMPATAAGPAAPKAKQPVMIIAAAFVVGAGLAVAAVYAFRASQPQAAKTSDKASTVGTSSTSSDAIQAAGGVLIKPGDLSDFSAALQSKIDQLNDTQDFSAKDLTDQTLGL